METAIAVEAVKQAEKTDHRVNELLHAAGSGWPVWSSEDHARI
jgi:hypothetical protein